MKRSISFILTLCIVLSVLLIMPAGMKADAYSDCLTYALNLRGETQRNAMFIIDPGHGNWNPGASYYGRVEKDEVLTVSLKVAKYIEQSGGTVSLTRITDIENPELEDKVYAQQTGTFNYFLSIHRNAGGGTGVETFYYEGSTNGRKLAEAVNSRVADATGWYNRGLKTNSLYVVSYTTTVAALIELGFMDSQDDNAIFDKYNDEISMAIADGLLSMEGLSYSNESVTSPNVTVSSTSAYGSNIAVSWDAVAKATSYSYKAVMWNGEVNVSGSTTVASGTTTSTSFSVPAQSSGKYVVVTVTAVDSKNSASTSKTVMIGPWVAYPTEYQYIPITEINGSTATSGSVIWTASKGSAFTATYWAAALCTPNSDGTYTVSAKYESGASKSVSVSGNNIVLATHSGYTNFEYAANLKVGDKIDLCGIYLTTSTIRGSGYALVNGGIPLVVEPKELSVKTDSGVTVDAEYATGIGASTNVDSIKAMFNEDASYVVVKDTMGAVVDSTFIVGTGCTINLVVDGEVKQSISVVVNGDISADGIVDSNDYLALRRHLGSKISINGAWLKAADCNNSGDVTTVDYIILKCILSE